jgi:glutamate--cysteine ligase
MACWLTADPGRTAPPAPAPGDPAAEWARRVVGTDLMCVRRDGGSWDAPPGVTFGDWVDGALGPPPTTADLDYHVSTLFPPVRPHGHVEVRYVDAQPGRHWALPVAVLAALLSDPEVTRRAREACAPAAGRWVPAARHGLADRVLQRAAATVFDLALGALPALEPPGWLVDDLVVVLAQRVRRGRCPADVAPSDLVPADLVAAAPPHTEAARTTAPHSPQHPAPFGDPEEARA